MTTTHVYLSSFFDDRNSRRTGLSRFELGIAVEFVKAGGRLVTFASTRRRMVELELSRNVSPIVRRQDEDSDWDELRHHRRAKPSSTGGGSPDGVIARLAASLGGSVMPHLHAMLFSPSAGFKPGDALVVPGIVWSDAALAEMRRLQRESRIRIVPFIHDLIPIRRPEFHTDDVGISRFRRYAETMAEIADDVCVSSEFVAGDVQTFLAAHGRPHTRVHRIPLCPDITRRTPRRSTPRIDSMNLEPDGYALYVSTLNARKNHDWLFDIWRELASTIGERTLPLVVAGQRGWGIGNLLQQFSADGASFGNAIRFVEAPTDAEVAHLYTNCAFTIFPSRYEGWGLGVTESLEFGKPCIAADNTALREAGQSLAIHLDLSDRQAWLGEIGRMCGDAAYRRRLVAIIERDYRTRTWADVGRDFLHAISGECS